MKQLLFILMAVLGLTACSNRSGASAENTETTKDPNITEVIYFHGKQRCITCRAIEDLTREVVDSLGNNQIVMRIVDISEKENQPIADKYEITWSSLVLDRNEKSENITEMAFSYAKGQPQVFKAKLVEAIQNISK